MPHAFTVVVVVVVITPSPILLAVHVRQPVLRPVPFLLVPSTVPPTLPVVLGVDRGEPVAPVVHRVVSPVATPVFLVVFTVSVVVPVVVLGIPTSLGVVVVALVVMGGGDGGVGGVAAQSVDFLLQASDYGVCFFYFSSELGFRLHGSFSFSLAVSFVFFQFPEGRIGKNRKYKFVHTLM